LEAAGWPPFFEVLFGFSGFIRRVATEFCPQSAKSVKGYLEAKRARNGKVAASRTPQLRGLTWFPAACKLRLPSARLPVFTPDQQVLSNHEPANTGPTATAQAKEEAANLHCR
jgi:hypothetical protein